MDEIARYFQVLDLTHHATFDEVKKAYKDLIRVWHPDRFQHDSKLQRKANEKLKEINEAFRELEDLNNKGLYNIYRQKVRADSNEDFSPHNHNNTDNFKESKQDTSSSSNYDKEPPKEPPFSKSTQGSYRADDEGTKQTNFQIGTFLIFLAVLVLIGRTLSFFGNKDNDISSSNQPSQSQTITNQGNDLRAEAEKWISKGKDFFKSKDYNNAIAAFNKAIQVKPDDSEAYNNRGVAYGQIKNYNQAIADFNKAIEIKPDFAKAYNSRGGVYNEIKNYTQAITDFNKAIEIKPDYAEAYYLRGYTYALIGNHNNAIADCNKAIQIKPDDADAYYYRGYIYGLTENYNQAIADFSKAIQIKPDYAEAYCSRGGAYGMLGNYNQAIADLNKAIQINPNYAGAYANRGFAYGSLGNYNQAIADLKIAARLGYAPAQETLRVAGESW